MLPEKIAHAMYEFIVGPLPENPQRVGKPLGPPLAPAYSARHGDYRVLYFIDYATRTVKVTAISTVQTHIARERLRSIAAGLKSSRNP